MLILRSDIYHSGHFGNRGNMRFHAVIAQENNFTFDRLRYLEGKAEPPHRRLPRATDVLKESIKKCPGAGMSNRYIRYLLKDFKGGVMNALIENYQFH